MSFTTVILPMLAALNTVQQELPTASWVQVNPLQHHLMNQYYPKRNDIFSKMLPSELRNCAGSYSVVNHFLKNNGFDIQLDPCPGLAVASIFDMTIEWKAPGEKWVLSVKDADSHEREYPAVLMEEGYVLRKLLDGSYIVEVFTKTGDKVYMALADIPLQGFELLDKVQSLSASHYINDTSSFSDVLFPMVDLDQAVDISWLIGMRYGEWKIAEALQQTKFQMDEKGAVVKSAVALGGESCAINAPPRFKIDRPFYIWIERPGIDMPLFAGYIDICNWKRPTRS